ncbi:DUF4352 domain-containing protein [Carnobacterium maltaromaticum]|uniref:DUF4352 domain-containing protein n=1 Tax=Carnobacterium maltaromaticum TaxID=2751 RepID=UPI0039BE3D56
MKKFLSLVFVGAIGILLIGCGANNTKENESNSEVSQDISIESSSEIESSESSIEPNRPLEIGQTNYFNMDGISGDLEVTLTAINKETAENEPDYNKPTGPYFIVVDFAVQNNTSESYTINAAEFSIYDGSGAKGDVASNNFVLEDLAPGKNYSGQIYFNVNGDGPFEVFLYGSSWSLDVQ